MIIIFIGILQYFLDGGYKVVLETSKEAYEKAIKECMEREKPNIKMNMSVRWIECPCQKGLAIDVQIINNQNMPYKGILRIYVVEINSRWKDYSANQYHFAFLEFAMLVMLH